MGEIVKVEISETVKFALILEKDAVFQKMVAQGFCEKHACILITGKKLQFVWQAVGYLAKPYCTVLSMSQGK